MSWKDGARICIGLMIFVNYGGGGYWFLKHSAWDGLTVADLVFPWFLFIMGTSLAFAAQANVRRGLPRHQVLAFYPSDPPSCPAQ